MTEDKVAMLACNLPSLVSNYPVGEAVVDRFQSDGHVFCPRLIEAAEIAVYRPRLMELAYAAEDRRQDHYRSFNNWEKSAVVRQLVFSSRVAAVAASLLRCECVQIHQDSIFLKLPGHRISNYHFDVAASPFHAPADYDIRYVTCWIPLTDLDADMGHLEFISGSHRLPLDDNRDVSRYLQENRADIEGKKVCYRPRMAGDASFHSGRTLHTGLPNTSRRERAALTIQYIASGTRIHSMAQDYLASCKDLDAWLDQQLASGALSEFETPQQILRRSADARWARHYEVNDCIRPDEALLPSPAL